MPGHGVVTWGLGFRAGYQWYNPQGVMRNMPEFMRDIYDPTRGTAFKEAL
jgi:hypothetical protein